MEKTEHHFSGIYRTEDKDLVFYLLGRCAGAMMEYQLFSPEPSEAYFAIPHPSQEEYIALVELVQHFKENVPDETKEKMKKLGNLTNVLVRYFHAADVRGLGMRMDLWDGNKRLGIKFDIKPTTLDKLWNLIIDYGVEKFGVSAEVSQDAGFRDYVFKQLAQLRFAFPFNAGNTLN